MNVDTTAGVCPAELPRAMPRVARWIGAVAWRLGLLAMLGAAWVVSGGAVYTSSSELGYWLGVAGGSLMALLLLYPLRKRFRALSALGPLRIWFRLHLFGGIVGPLVILFHSTFRVGSFNAGVALGSMLLVVASGIVGRYLYRKIHNGLYGSRASAAELERALARQLEALKPTLAEVPLVARELSRYAALVAHRPDGRAMRAWHFASLGARRLAAGWRVRRAIGRYSEDPYGVVHGPLHDAADTLDDALAAIQRSAQFATYERLFSLWHAVHIPFLVLLVITAVVHVLAVHAY
ncbi:MAG TPA: hypothetical protein VF816_03385 [Rhodocyclaceae bacterium]